MNVEISWPAVGVGLSAGTAAGGLLIRWVNESMGAAKAARAILFDKYDQLDRKLQDHRLHVAEVYLTRTALREQLEPIHKTLEEIKEDLRDERSK